MWLAHDRNPLNQPIMKDDIEAMNPLIGSNENQGIAQIPMCDNVRWRQTQGEPLRKRPMILIDVEQKVTYQ